MGSHIALVTWPSYPMASICCIQYYQHLKGLVKLVMCSEWWVDINTLAELNLFHHSNIVTQKVVSPI